MQFPLGLGFGLGVLTYCGHGRIRHVKCDEEKPSCLQCRKTGRTCDGYEHTVSAAKVHSKSHPGTLASPPISSLYRISTRLPANEDELRSFDFFQSSMGPYVFDSFNLNVIDKVIMQLSVSDDTIKHALIALGSLGEQFAKHGSQSPKVLDDEKRLHFARLQNFTAIQRLRKKLSHNEHLSIELALICCFLFVIFDFLLGDDVSSYAHLKAGLNILRGW